MHRFASLDEVSQTLDGLPGRGRAEHGGRGAGQKEDRYRQLLGEEAEDDAPAAPAPPTPPAPTSAPPPSPPAPVADDRVEGLEREVAALRAELEDLKTQLGVS